MLTGQDVINVCQIQGELTAAREQLKATLALADARGELLEQLSDLLLDGRPEAELEEGAKALAKELETLRLATVPRTLAELSAQRSLLAPPSDDAPGRCAACYGPLVSGGHLPWCNWSPERVTP